MSAPIVRFAPSPTGYLHVGNARMAMINALYAKHTGGTFWLRLDDTDPERSKEEYAQGIREDLNWLGIPADQETKQSDRLATYDAAFEKLKADGRVYPCYESPEELDRLRKRQQAAKMPPLYDRAALDPSDEQKARWEGRDAHWRFKLDHTEITWVDLVRGPVKFQGKKLSDPVIKRADGSWLYMLPSSVDDVEMGITHVVRGEDHVANTAAQLQMIEAIGGVVPAFAHLPLMSDISGGGLSKRDGSLALRDMRKDGIEAQALSSYLAHMGTSDDIKVEDMAALAAEFDFSHFSRATAKFDPAHLNRLNAEVLHGLDYAAAADRLGEFDGGEDFWNAVRPNIERFDDVAQWYAVCFGDVTSPDGDSEFLKAAHDALPPEPWDDTTWGTWTKAVKDATGVKGKGLFMPLRQFLTGVDHGPELKVLLPLIGRTRVLERFGNVL